METKVTKAYETKRLNLRVIEEVDQDFIYKQFSNELVNQYLFDAEPLKNIEEALDIIHFYRKTRPKNQERFMMILKDQGDTIGTLGYHAYDEGSKSLFIGYDLYPDYTKQGYMQEALAFLLNYLKTVLNVRTVYACIYKDNVRSINTVKRFGFTHHKNTYEHFRGKEYLHYIYQLVLE